MSFHKQIFLNNRTDTPNRYAATCAASGTAASTSGFHVGTYKQDNMEMLSSNAASLFLVTSFYKPNI
jgi:hypothetical protein